MARRRSRPRLGVQVGSATVGKASTPSLQTTLVFLGLVLWMGTQVVRLGHQELTLFQRGRLLEEEKAVVQSQHHELRAEIAAASTNAGVERLAREQLGFVMAEEIPVKAVVAPAGAESRAEPRVAAAPEPAPAAQGADLPPALAALAKFFVPMWR